MKLRLFPAIFVVTASSLALRVVGMVAGDDLSTSNLAFAADEVAQDAEAQNPAQNPVQNNGQAGQQAASNTAPQTTVGSQGQTIDGNRLDLPSSPSQAYGLPTDQELLLISQLRERREQLDRREQKINLQEQLLAGTEARINDKIQALQTLEGQIKEHLRIFEEQEAEQLNNVVLVYQAMKPKDAAARFQELDIKVQVDLAMRMKNRAFAGILSKMDPAKATALTVELATRAEPPSIENLQGGR